MMGMRLLVLFLQSSFLATKPFCDLCDMQWVFVAGVIGEIIIATIASPCTALVTALCTSNGAIDRFVFGNINHNNARPINTPNSSIVAA